MASATKRKKFYNIDSRPLGNIYITVSVLLVVAVSTERYLVQIKSYKTFFPLSWILQQNKLGNNLLKLLILVLDILVGLVKKYILLVFISNIRLG
jgi:hypothetical protein